MDISFNKFLCGIFYEVKHSFEASKTERCNWRFGGKKTRSLRLLNFDPHTYEEKKNHFFNCY